MKTGFKLVAALAAAAVMTCAPAVANAAPAVTITTDTGQPAVLAPGTNPTLRNMSVETALTVADADAMRWTWSVIGPDGVAAVTESSCWSINTDGRRVPYRGNGTYTLTLKAYAANACTGTPVVTTYTWTVGASVAIGQPAGPLPTRPANTAVTNTLMLDFAGNPGATTYEIRYAKGAVLAADGSISGPSETAFVDSTTGKIRFSNFDGPGTYTFVARAQTGDFYTPWSAPANVTLIAPFDLRTASFSDRRGPSYQLRGEVREVAAAGGRVTVAIAKGKNGKRFRTLGRAKINSKGAFKLRFTQRKLGWYRLRYSYKGSSAVERGTAYAQVRFRRVIV